MSRLSTRINLLSLLFFCITPVFSDEEATTCSAYIKDVTPPSVISYYPYERRIQSETIEVDIVSEGQCNLSLTVKTHKDGMKGPQGKLNYYIEDSRGSRIVTDGTRRIPIRDHEKTSHMRFFIFTPSGQDSPPGNYREDVRFQLFSSDNLIVEKYFTFSARVHHQAVISAASSRASGFTFNQGTMLDFGNLYTGQRQSAYLFVKSNSHYSLEITSENQGRLKNKNHSGPSGYIDYTAWLNRERLNLNPRDTISFNRSQTIGSERPHDLTVEIGEVANRVAGSYRDMLTIDVIILE